MFNVSVMWFVCTCAVCIVFCMDSEHMVFLVFKAVFCIILSVCVYCQVSNERYHCAGRHDVTLLFLLCPGMAVTFVYWLLLQILNSHLYVVTIPLLIGHSILIISFQFFLIIPKVYQPLWRQLKRKHS